MEELGLNGKFYIYCILMQFLYEINNKITP